MQVKVTVNGKDVILSGTAEEVFVAMRVIGAKCDNKPDVFTDIKEFLDGEVYYSASKDKYMPYSNMNFVHVYNAMAKIINNRPWGQSAEDVLNNPTFQCLVVRLAESLLLGEV